MITYEKNIYGLSETMIKTCEFLGLNFDKNLADENLFAGDKFPSDYFGENFELDLKLKTKIMRASKRTKAIFEKSYENFSGKFFTQKSIVQNKTNLNVYFCDYCLYSNKNLKADIDDYFDFEFYKKSPELQKTFRLQKHRKSDRITCNERNFCKMFDNKVKANRVFANYVHRDWLDARFCTLEEFKYFTEKHSKFFAKPIFGSMGRGAEIIQITGDEDISEMFSKFKNEKFVLEEIISQHEKINEFCPDTVNTVRINTFLDVHNNVHILTAAGRFGRMGTAVDNYSSGGHSVTVDPKTGIIISDGINHFHERTEAHPDTGKVFKGFKYPFWGKVQNAVKQMAHIFPTVHHIGWDITINSKGEVELVEANANPDVHIQQSPDSVGRLHLYKTLIDELEEYQKAQLDFLGYRNNNVENFYSAYKEYFSEEIAEFAMQHLIPECGSILDVGCRKDKFVKNFCKEKIQYYPVDFKKHDSEIIACNFNKGAFPNIKADACICAITAEFVIQLPRFLKNLCNAAQKQIVIICRPLYKEKKRLYRWRNPFLTDFTEEFLFKTMHRNNFNLNEAKPFEKDSSIILYDFRKNIESENV